MNLCKVDYNIFRDSYSILVGLEIAKKIYPPGSDYWFYSGARCKKANEMHDVLQVQDIDVLEDIIGTDDVDELSEKIKRIHDKNLSRINHEMSILNMIKNNEKLLKKA
jgi:hypothetical protein